MVLERQDTFSLPDHTNLVQNGELGALDGMLVENLLDDLGFDSSLERGFNVESPCRSDAHATHLRPHMGQVHPRADAPAKSINLMVRVHQFRTEPCGRRTQPFACVRRSCSGGVVLFTRSDSPRAGGIEVARILHSSWSTHQESTCSNDPR